MKFPALKTLHPLVLFPIAIIFFQLMGGAMGWITSQSIEGWYRTLDKSPLNPPDWAFGVAWTTLYLLLSVSFGLLLQAPESRARTYALSLFVFHMVLNWCWTPLFFTAHALFPSFALILVLVFTAAMLAWLAYPLNKFTALAFLPYLLWLALAGHLAHYIWQNN